MVVDLCLYVVIPEPSLSWRIPLAEVNTNRADTRLRNFSL